MLCYTFSMKKLPNLTPFLVPSSKDLVFIFFFYLVLILGTAFFRDGDPGRHITFGRYLLATGSTPTEDIFTYTTAGVYLPLYEWLSQVVFGAAHNLLGLGGVVLVCAALIASMLTLTYQEFLRRKLPTLAAFVLVAWLGILTMVHWAARPHLFSLFFMALISPWLARLAEGEKIPLWWFPALMVVWVNTHGAAFTLVFLLWAAYIAGNAWDSWRSRSPILNPVMWRLLFSGALTLAATFVNPAGWRLWEFILGFMGNSYLLEVAGETRSVDFHGFNSYPFLLTLAGTLLLLSRSQEKRPMAESLLLVGWMALGLYGWRNIPIYGLVTFPILAEHLRHFVSEIPWVVRPSRMVEQLEGGLRGRFWSLVVSLALAGTLAGGMKLDFAKEGYHFNRYEFPTQALDWLEENPQPGRMFNYFPWGGYMIYRIWPAYSMFIDGQMIYIEDLVRDYYQVLEAKPGWEETAQAYQITWMLIPTNARIVHDTSDSDRWQVLYQDDVATILRKK